MLPVAGCGIINEGDKKEDDVEEKKAGDEEEVI